MMKLRSVIVLTILAASMGFTAWAADINGKWSAAFHTGGGDEKYVYTFTLNGETLTGTAKNERGEVAITEGTVKGDDVTFVENLKAGTGTMKILYVGKISGDQIAFTRHVGTPEFATEQMVATRIVEK
jgi:hypothetical protein